MQPMGLCMLFCYDFSYQQDIISSFHLFIVFHQQQSARECVNVFYVCDVEKIWRYQVKKASRVMEAQQVIVTDGEHFCR